MSCSKRLGKNAIGSNQSDWEIGLTKKYPDIKDSGTKACKKYFGDEFVCAGMPSKKQQDVIDKKFSGKGFAVDVGVAKGCAYRNYGADGTRWVCKRDKCSGSAKDCCVNNYAQVDAKRTCHGKYRDYNPKECSKHMNSYCNASKIFTDPRCRKWETAKPAEYALQVGNVCKDTPKGSASYCGTYCEMNPDKCTNYTANVNEIVADQRGGGSDTYTEIGGTNASTSNTNVDVSNATDVNVEGGDSANASYRNASDVIAEKVNTSMMIVVMVLIFLCVLAIAIFFGVKKMRAHSTSTQTMQASTQSMQYPESSGIYGTPIRPIEY